MEMSKRLRAVIALVLVVCVLLPATAFSLQYAPNAPRNAVLDGHSDPPFEAQTVDRVVPSARVIWLILPFSLSSRLVLGYSSHYGFVIAWK